MVRIYSHLRNEIDYAGSVERYFAIIISLPMYRDKLCVNDLLFVPL
jgi:hypothetical protein